MNKDVIDFLEGMDIEEPNTTEAQLVGKVDALIYRLNCDICELSFIFGKHPKLFDQVNRKGIDYLGYQMIQQGEFTKDTLEGRKPPNDSNDSK